MKDSFLEFKLDLSEIPLDQPKFELNLPELDFAPLEFDFRLPEASLNLSEFDFESPKFEFPKLEFEFLNMSIELDIESEPIPEPDPNLTAKDVAAWMLQQVEANGKLYQKNAAWHIRRYFGERFIYPNENHNPAISRDVLKEFLLISLKTVVWNRRERFWRTKRPGDPLNRRMVED